MFKNRLRFVREQKKMTQAEFAALANLGISAQTNYERGLRVPDLNYIEALAKYGVDIGYLLTGIPTDMSALSNDEKELLQNYRMVSSLEKQAILTVSKTFANRNGNSDQDPDNEDKGLSVISKKSHSKKKTKNSSLMNIIRNTPMYHYYKKMYAEFMTISREVYLCRTSLYSTTVVVAVLVAIIGMLAINYVMMIGNDFNSPEYNWLAMTAYSVMNITGVAVLSKFIMTRLSPLFDK